MILLWLIILLMGGGILAWIAARWNVLISKWISLIAMLTSFAITLSIWWQADLSYQADNWIIQVSYPWIPSFGIGFTVALDGLSLLMLLLTFLLGILCVLTSWKEIQYRPGFYYFNLLWVIAGITGVFITLDM